MKFEGLHLSSETKLIIAFTAIIWVFRASTSSILFMAGPTESGNIWYPQLLLIIYYMLITIMLWGFLRLIASWHIAIVFMLGPIIAFPADMLHTELFHITQGNGLWLVYKELGWKSYLYNTYLGSLFFLAWYMGYLAVVNYSKFVRENIAVTEIETQAREAKLQMLRHQIDPHFLFNTLNSISSLVLDKKNRRAEKMINGLGQFLRFSFEKSDVVKISLKEEIDILKEYLLIEEIRFSDKLETTFNIAPDTLRCLVPSLILQPAVENALKHAISPKKSDGTIHIASHLQNGELHVSVTDNGPGLTEGQSFRGVGVRNMRARIRGLYRARGSLEIANQNGGGVRVNIRIPAEYSAKKESP